MRAAPLPRETTSVDADDANLAADATRQEPLNASADAHAEPTGEAATETSGHLDVERNAGALPLPIILKTLQTRYGKSYQQVFSEIVRLSFGPGKISMEEYLELGLFDDQALADADKRAFVGYSVSQKLWEQANFRKDWHGFLDEKLAVTSLLGAYGYPVVPTLAIFTTNRSFPAFKTLRDHDELRIFLTDPAHYPLFGKPVDGAQSLGSISFDNVDLEQGRLRTVQGERVAIDDIVAEITEHYAEGYMFQPRVVPHKRVREICGNRLATVRVMTMLTPSGPQVLRAMWKLPVGDNAADNFWRPGNMVAQLDPVDGRIMRLQSGTGLEAQEHRVHPDTGMALIDTRVPHWGAVIDTALEAAKVLKEAPLLGWDIAPTDEGAVIIEPNYTPDLHLAQIADRRGIMDETFTAFLASCAEMRDARRARNRSERRAHTRANRERVLAGVRSGVRV
ncbi:MAG: sugar-transfer associated ATP-grasp domain-containing protein [Pseudomonadota bacterium]